MLFRKKSRVCVREGKEFEICVLCGAVTDVLSKTPLEQRGNYISGAGQLCRRCAALLKKEGQVWTKNGLV